MTIGVTGPSGAGKSLFCSLLAERGFCVLDCDKIYHSIISAPSDCTRELAATFGSGILLPSGGVDRSALSNIVFFDPSLLARLNRITHKYVRVELTRLMSEADMPIVIDAPLLFEAKCDRLCDATIGILAANADRVARLWARDGAHRTHGQLSARIDASPPDDFYKERCTHIFTNDRGTAALCEFADKITELYGLRNASTEEAIKA